MSESPTTRHSLLARLRDVGDEGAWSDFVRLYAPLVYSLARKHDLQDADAADLTQDVLRSMVQALPRLVYDPARGSFRGFLFTAARNQIRKQVMARKRGPVNSELLDEMPAPEEVAAWEQEYQRHVFGLAAERVRDGFRPATWQAFWRTSVDGEEAQRVGDELGLSVGAVYIARTRVLARIREAVRELEGDV